MSISRRYILLPVMVTLLMLGVDAQVNGQRTKTQKLGDWGTVTDPDGDCEFDTDDERLRITVPGTNHDLTLEGGQKAPRVLKKVTGDFTVQVKVTSEFKPSMTSVGKGRPYNGAGILVWQSERNFIRLERNSYWIDNQILNCYPPQIAYFSGGQQVHAVNMEPTTADFFKGQSTWLKLRRQGTNLTVSISHDGAAWIDMKTFRVKLSEQLSVGVVAVNTCNEPFVVDFEGLSLTTKGK